MVTTGGRGCRLSAGSSSPPRPISISDSDTRWIRCPNSPATNSAVSPSIACVAVAMMFSFISSFTTSAVRSAIRFANSPTVILSGIITSRSCLTCGCSSRIRARSRWRLTDASERWRRLSSPDKACVMVILPDWRRPAASRRGAGRRGAISSASRRRRFCISVGVGPNLLAAVAASLGASSVT